MYATICQLLLLFYVSAVDADAGSYVYGVTPTAVGCNFPQQKRMKRSNGLGFDIRVFEYEFEDMTSAHNEGFMASGYTNDNVEFSYRAVTDINLSGDDNGASALFGENLEEPNFVAEFTSYLGVTESGFYKFESDITVGSMMFFIGGAEALQCCALATNFDFTTVNSSSYNMFTAIHDAETQFYYQYLEAYHFYPVRIVYANMGTDYAMSLKVTYPDGSVYTKFDNGDFYAPYDLSMTWDIDYCRSYVVSADTVSVVTSWTGSTASYTTYTPSTGDDAFTEYQYYPDPTTTVSSHYHDSTISSTLITPTGAGTWTEAIFYPEETVTSNVTWTGATTVTSTTIIPENAEVPATVVVEVPGPIITTTHLWTGAETSSTTIYPTNGPNGTITVEVFTPRETIISYVPWTGTTTKTSTTIAPENQEIPATIVVEVPDAITTTTHLWTGTETSSTTIYPVEGKNGTITVEVLNPRDVITSTIIWTGSFISTYTTIFQEDSNGTVTVGVEIPRTTKTFTNFWSGSTTSYTTEYPSDLNNEVIVHEYFPQSVASDGIIYITTYWTGDFTSYSTMNPGYSNGTILVNIPQQTVTETWSGTVTSTSFYCPFSGADSTPVVLVPSSTAVSGNCDNCESSLISSSISQSVEAYVPSSGSGKPSKPSSTSEASTSSFGSSLSGSTESPSLDQQTELSSSLPDIDIAYSNSGNTFVFFNAILIVSLLFSFYIII